MTVLPETTVVTLTDVQPVQGEDGIYYQMAYQTLDNPEIQHFQTTPDVFYKDPVPGDRVELYLLNGEVIRAGKLN